MLVCLILHDWLGGSPGALCLGGIELEFFGSVPAAAPSMPAIPSSHVPGMQRN